MKLGFDIRAFAFGDAADAASAMTTVVLADARRQADAVISTYGITNVLPAVMLEFTGEAIRPLVML